VPLERSSPAGPEGRAPPTARSTGISTNWGASARVRPQPNADCRRTGTTLGLATLRGLPNAPCRGVHLGRTLTLTRGRNRPACTMTLQTSSRGCDRLPSHSLVTIWSYNFFAGASHAINRSGQARCALEHSPISLQERLEARPHRSSDRRRTGEEVRGMPRADRRAPAQCLSKQI